MSGDFSNSASQEPDPQGEASELDDYFRLEGSNADPNNILVLPAVPSLIGGPKSAKFVETPADQNPEDQAERGYSLALLEAMQTLSELPSAGQNITTLFIPDTIGPDAVDYARRLKRLAQDTGVTVSIRQQGHDGPDRYTIIRKFRPPAANSVDDYWRTRKTNLADRKRYPSHEPPSEPTQDDEGVIDILLRLTPKPGGQYLEIALEANLRIVAGYDTEKLKSWLLGEEAPAAASLTTIQDLACMTWGHTDGVTSQARIIAAKLDDPKCLSAINLNLSRLSGDEVQGELRSDKLIKIPLSIYLQRDPSFLAAVGLRIDQLVANYRPEVRAELMNLAGAVCHSGSPEAGKIISNLLGTFLGTEGGHASIKSLSIDDYIHYLRSVASLPKTPQLNDIILGIEEKLANLLGSIISGKLDHHGAQNWRAINDIFDVLLSGGKPRHRQVLEGYMRYLYEKGGCIITDVTFENEYIAYREQYGDIPELQPQCIKGEPAVTRTANVKPVNLIADNTPNLKELLNELQERIEILHRSLGELATNLKRLIEMLRDDDY